MAGCTLQLSPITATLHTIQLRQTNFKISGVKSRTRSPISPCTQISVYPSLLNSYNAEYLYFNRFSNIQAGFKHGSQRILLLPQKINNSTGQDRLRDVLQDKHI
jgi:hypothetical protein